MIGKKPHKTIEGKIRIFSKDADSVSSCFQILQQTRVGHQYSGEDKSLKVR
jgi:hypothetical protein